RSSEGDGERTINLKNPIPVHVTYQTAFVDHSGQLNLREDIYGLDAAMLKLIPGSERIIADTPIPRNYGSERKPVVARLPSRSAPREYSQEQGWNNSGGSNGGGWNYGRGWDFGRSGANSYAAYPQGGVRYFDRAMRGW